MSDDEISPMLDRGATSLEAHVLRWARSERAPSDAQDRILIALGIGAGAALATGTAAAQTAPRALALATKWLLIGALSGVITTEVAHRIVARGHEAPADDSATIARAPTRAKSPPPMAPASDPLAVSPLSSAPPPTDLEPKRSVPTGVAAPASASASPAAAPAGEVPSTGRFETPENIPLGHEVALLDRARSLLDSGNPSQALAVIDQHQRRFPKGRLAPEASYLRIRSLVALGDRAGAEQAASRFIEQNPGSPETKRVRALLGTTGKTR